MATNIVRKGQNRAYAMDKTSRHAQRTPLPPRAGQVAEAAEAIRLAQEAIEMGKKDKAAKKAKRVSVPEQRKAEIAELNAVANEVVAKVKKDKAPKIPKARTEAATLAPTAAARPKGTPVAGSKAQAFLTDATAAGWDGEVETRNGAVVVETATVRRGSEVIVIEWQNGACMEGTLHTRADGSTVKLRNASAARQVMAAAPPTPEALAATAARRQRIGGATRVARRSIPFDMGTMLDEELSEALKGAKVIWVNSISGAEEIDWIPGNSKVRIDEQPSGRTVHFNSGSARSVRISSIISVTGSKKRPKISA